jgi:hypothetical protein
MNAIDRREILCGFLCGAALATTGAAGLALTPDKVEAMPLAVDKRLIERSDDLIEKAAVAVHPKQRLPPRRHRRHRGRRWRCWWHRGRRKCVRR